MPIKDLTGKTVKLTEKTVKMISSKVTEKMDSTEIPIDTLIEKSIQIPGVRVDRNKFLAGQFAKDHADMIQEIIVKGPVEAGITRAEINDLAGKLIITRTSESSAASFLAGIPGGLALAAAVPADVLQFFGMALRLAQELAYLFGTDDLFEGGEIDSEKVKFQLLMYCGTMFGVSGAANGLRVLSTQLAKTTLKKLPQKALTKTFWYPIVKKIGTVIGLHVTKQTTAKAISNIIPVVGGVISGTLNFVTMKPMAKRLHTELDKATFDYSEEEFENDIKIIENIEYDEDDVYPDFNTEEAVVKSSSIADYDQNNKQDVFEEIKKFKELLDMNIITQEEFDEKKKELLGL